MHVVFLRPHVGQVRLRFLDVERLAVVVADAGRLTDDVAVADAGRLRVDAGFFLQRFCRMRSADLPRVTDTMISTVV